MDIEKLTDAVTKAIGYAENGGKPDLNNLSSGRTGEMKSIFQFTPNTWKLYSKQAFGKETPLTPDAETYVVKHKVKDWLNKGYKPEQIASMWNAGESESNAYTGKFSTGHPSVGLNKTYNVRYDVPSYASKVSNYTKQFYSEGNQQPQNMAQNQQGFGGFDNNPHVKNLLSLINNNKQLSLDNKPIPSVTGEVSSPQPFQ